MKARFLALAALVLGLASCQTDFDLAPQQGGEVDFQLKVDAVELATRAGDDANNPLAGLDSAYGAIDYLQATDWSAADLRYTLEVYDYDTTEEYTNAEPVKERMVKVVGEYEPVAFKLRLVPGRKYHFVVFADFVAEGSAVDYNGDGLFHQIGTTLADITVINDDINHECSDAYFATEDFTITNSDAQDMTLRRPYGKLRVVATDMKELNLNLKPGKVEVKYYAPHPTTFNALTGAIESVTATNTITFDEPLNAANHIYTAGYDAQETHMTLFTDYILAESQQSAIHFDMSVYDEDGVIIKETQFNTDIPVQRNHLTTIIGNVLTTATEIDVTIDDNFSQPDHVWNAVTTGLELLNAIYSGGNFVLVNDITITREDYDKFMSTRASSFDTVIDLNGFTITFEDDVTVEIPTGSTLTIEDQSENEGTIEAGEDAGFVNEGTLNINGGTIGEGTVENNGTTNINGGKVESDAIENNGTINVDNEDAVEDDAINNGTDAIVGKTVKTAEELQAAIAAAANTEVTNEVSFAANIAGDVTVLQKEGINLIINGQGYKFDGTITVNGNARATGTETLKITNINFETAKSDFTFISAPSKIDNRYNYTHNVTIEGCTFKANQTVGCASFTGTYNFVMKNCEANNVHSILQTQSCDNTVTVENVTVTDAKNGLSFGNTASPTLKNSTINAAEYGVRGDGNASRGKLVVENTTINANVPVIIRKVTTDGYSVDLTGATLTKGKDSYYHVVFTKGSDDETYAAPEKEFSYNIADEYMVFPREYIVYDQDQLIEALANNANVIFANDIKIDPATQSNAYGATGLNVKKGNSIFGNGYTLDIKGAGGTWDSGINTTGGLIQDLKVTGSFRGIFVNHNSDYSETVVLENVTIEGTTYTISCDQGLGQNLEAYNSTFNGWTSYAATIGEVKFTDCEFGYGSGYKFCRPYAPTTFVGCNFCEGYTVDPRAAVSFENCTLAGEPLTVENIAKLTSNRDKVLVNDLKPYAEGVGTDTEGAYCIAGKAGMFWFANEVNVNKNAFNGQVVKLAGDIDLNNEVWTPVGQTGVATFNGVFDGQNYTISNLNINSEDQTGAYYSSGLFDWVETHSEGRGHIKNVKIDGAAITGHHNCGALVGYITEKYALVENCHVANATISCTKANDDADGDKAGALIGNATNATIVKNCTATDSTVSAGRDSGQLIGAAKEANVTGCSATNVTVEANGTGTGKNIRNEVIGRLL